MYRIRRLGLVTLSLIVASSSFAWAAPSSPTMRQRQTKAKASAPTRASTTTTVHQFYHKGVLYTVDYDGSVVAVGSYSGSAVVANPMRPRPGSTASLSRGVNPISANGAPLVSTPGRGFDLQAALAAQRRQPPQVYYVLGPGGSGTYGSMPVMGANMIQNYSYSYPLTNTANPQGIVTGAVISGNAAGGTVFPGGISTTGGGAPVVNTTGVPFTAGGAVPVILSPGASTTNALIPIVTTNGALIPTFTPGLNTVPSFTNPSVTTVLPGGTTTGATIIVGPGVLGTGGGQAVPTFTGAGGVPVQTVPVPTR